MVENSPSVKKVDPVVKWGAILVVGLMLLSGIAVFIGGQSASQDDNTGNGSNSPDTPVDTFIADDVQGTVTDVFQSAIVGGITPLSDKTEIDEALQKVLGVQSLTSQFTNLNSEDNSLTYVANITLKEGVNHETFAQDVSALDLFTAPEIYFQAAVQVPATLEAQNSNNETQSITLPNSRIQGIVSPSTLKGDIISGRVSAGFQGVQYVNAFIIETQNVSASPTPLTFSSSYSISQLEPTLTLAGSLTYYPSLSAQSLEEGIRGVQGVSAVSPPIIPQLNNTLVLTFLDFNAVAEDIESFIADHSDQFSDVQLTESGLRVGLKNVSVPVAKSLLTDVIQQALLSNAPIEFTDPVTQFLVDVNASGADTIFLSAKLKTYFEGLNASASVEIFQNGSINLDSLTVPETNKSYPIENGVLRVSVFPGHEAGDTVSLFITAIAIREKLVYINGQEAPPVDSNPAP